MEVPPNEMLCPVPLMLFPTNGVVGDLFPEAVVALVVDNSPWSKCWWHGGSGEVLRVRKKRIGPSFIGIAQPILLDFYCTTHLSPLAFKSRLWSPNDIISNIIFLLSYCLGNVLDHDPHQLLNSQHDL